MGSNVCHAGLDPGVGEGGGGGGDPGGAGFPDPPPACFMCQFLITLSAMTANRYFNSITRGELCDYSPRSQAPPRKNESLRGGSLGDNLT